MSRQAVGESRATVKLTQTERAALGAEFNLADGHARVFDRAFWAAFEETDAEAVHQLSQETAEEDFLRAFSRTTGQDLNLFCDSQLILPSASLSLELVASAMRVSGMRALAPSPCFDNVIDIFRHHDVPLTAYDVERGGVEGILKAIERSSLDAVLVVSPGNPTGAFADFAELNAIIDQVVAKDMLLILDASFRAFSESLTSADVYGELDRTGCRFAVIEDTGKFISSYEMKASVLTADPETFPALRSLYNDLMICHSALVLRILGRTLELTGREGISVLRRIVSENRDLLWRLSIPGLTRAASWSECSVEWVETQANDDVCERLAGKGIQILSGEQFYWDGTVRDRVRIALLRDPAYFETAMRRLQ